MHGKMRGKIRTLALHVRCDKVNVQHVEISHDAVMSKIHPVSPFVCPISVVISSKNDWKCLKSTT